MMARIGATPVPGPTQMTGVAPSGGKLKRPFFKPIGSLSPVACQRPAHPTRLGNAHLASSATCNPYRAHAGISGALSCIGPWRRRGELAWDGTSDVRISDAHCAVKLPTLQELAMENWRGRRGGNTSNTYSRGMRADLNSSNTSRIIRRGRWQYS